MSTKKILLLFLPLLFIFNNTISLFIFYLSNQTTQSYEQMLNRMIVYENVVKGAEQLVITNYQYITNSSSEARQLVESERKQLILLNDELQLLTHLSNDELAHRRVKQLVNSFIELEDQLAVALQYKQDLTYGVLYENLNQLSLFISDESYRLIGIEMNSYQAWYKQLLIEMNQIKQYGILLIVVNTILSLMLAYWISQRISQPIQKLVHMAKNISSGRLDGTVPSFEQHNEFSILAQSFDDMQSNIKQLLQKEKEAAEKDKQLTRMELEVLQSQINPHFLFNTLNALSKLALIEGAEKTSDLTVSLSNLFRYNLRQLDRPVTLKEEMRHAQEYFHIQQARFRDRVTFELEIDEEQLTTLVPVLTLQPILENIFVHGIEGIERPAIVTLAIFAEQTYTVISISDNGVGMDKQTLQSLLSYRNHDNSQNHEQQKKKSTGIGTRNVFRRIELLYKQEGLIDIYSEHLVGTTVTIRIPRLEQENYNVPHINS